jgi:chloramphenicol O-acetyltransferase
MNKDNDKQRTEMINNDITLTLDMMDNNEYNISEGLTFATNLLVHVMSAISEVSNIPMDKLKNHMISILSDVIDQFNEEGEVDDSL